MVGGGRGFVDQATSVDVIAEACDGLAVGAQLSRYDTHPRAADADLDAAVEAYRKGWHQTAPRCKAAAATNLAHGLYARFRLTGPTKDLDEATERYAEAHQAMPLYARSSVNVLSGQADCLLMGNQLCGDPRHLEEAISAQRLAAQRTPPDAAGPPDRLQQLAIALTTRYDLTRDTGDFDEAITSLQTAIQLAADDRAELHVCAAALGEYMRRFYASAGLEV